MLQMIFKLLSVIILIRSAKALVGYDCSGVHPNGTLISLLETDQCKDPKEKIILHSVQLELLQLPELTDISVLACRIELDNVVYDSENSESSGHTIHKNHRSYLPVSLSDCIYMHAHGKLQFKNITYDSLETDVTNSRLLPIGITDFSLSETSQKDNNRIKSYVHISFKQHVVRVNTLENNIILSASACEYTKLHCVDEDGYYNFWSPLFYKGCQLGSHTLKYRGIATRIQSLKSIAYSLPYKSSGVLFFVRTRHEICNTTLLQTEHPRFVVKEINVAHAKLQFSQLHETVDSVSPYYHVIRDASENMKLSYSRILLSQCVKRELELRVAMQFAHLDPSLFAYAVTGGPGHSAHIRGEAAQLFPCIPMPVQMRSTGNCFKELPITVNDAPMYLSPRTRAITATGTEVACMPETATIFRLKNIWAQYLPHMKNISALEIRRASALPWGRSHTAHAFDKADDEPSMAPQRKIPTSGDNLSPARETIRICWIGFCIIGLAAIISPWLFIKRKKSTAIAVLPNHIEKVSPPKMTQPTEFSSLPNDYDQALEVHRTSSTPPARTRVDDSVKSYSRSTENHRPVYNSTLLDELAAVSQSLTLMERRINKCIP